jgi:hypothetical protein
MAQHCIAKLFQDRIILAILVHIHMACRSTKELVLGIYFKVAHVHVDCW